MTREAFSRRFAVSRETLDRLDRFAEILKKWNPKINLVAKTTLPDLWTRHMADSAQIMQLAGNPGSHWVDLGSGGGFPGIVAAIMSAEHFPGTRFTLVESDQRKCAFLRSVAREAGVEIEVIAGRIEIAPPLGATTLSARALAPLQALLEMADRHLVAEGQAIFPKGANHISEVEAARKTWSFSLKTIPSMTDKEAAILKIGDIERV